MPNWKTNWKMIAVSLLFPIVLSVSLFALQHQPLPSDRVIKIDVDLVLVNVTVTDSRNRFVQDLKKENFWVWEDKIEQDIIHFSGEDAPVSLGIIFDKSGSMGGPPPKGAPPKNTPIDQIRSMAYTCLQDGSRQDEYFLIEFSDQAQVVADFTTDISKLRDKLAFLGAGGRTALWDAIYAGISKLKSASYSRKALLVLTDGMENRSRRSLSDLKNILREQDVRIYGMDPNEVLISGLDQLAELTGGRVFRSATPCKELAADLKNQYVIGYRPTNRATDGGFRNIRVRIEPSSLPKELSNLSVRARTGYYAKSEEDAEPGE
jgi:Ca-activated chloride channel family protein